MDDRWVYIAQPGGGNKYFYDAVNQKLAVCRKEDDNPDDAKFGVLYVDGDKIKAGALGIGWQEVERGDDQPIEINPVPLRRENGAHASIRCNVTEMLWLSKHFDAHLYASFGPKNTFKIVEQG